MRKMILLIGALIIAGASFGQLTGSKSIGSAGPNDYPTIAAAIADLNMMGVGPGGVTFNIAAGYTESFLSPTAGTITATGTVSSPVLFQKSGAGANPVVTAGVGTSTTTDGIIKIAGGDYFTFDGIDLLESAANTTPTTQMEWGYALVKARNTFPVDGCQYVTIRNCSISLNGTNTAASGIYSGNHIATTTSPAPNGTLYTTSDYTNNCKFYGNTIFNVFRGFNLNGFNDNLNNPPTSFDMNTEIGMAGAGNTITQNVSSSSTTCYGIWTNYQANVKIAYNTVNGNNAIGAIYGITPRVANSADIHHNTISISSAGSSGNYGIDLYGAGSSGYTTEVHDNLIQNCIQSGTGGFTGIYGGTSGPSVLNIFANTFTGNTTVTGSMVFIGSGGGGGNVNNVYNNLIYNNTKTGSGNFYGISGINYKNCNIYDNEIYSNNIATTGIVTTASTLVGIQSGQNAQTSETINNNQIYDLNITGTTTATGNFIYGINTDIVAASTRSWYNNVVRNLSISAPAGSGTVIGMRAANGSTGNIYRNQVYNLSAGNAAGAVQGVLISSGTQVNVYNNFISDLQTPASGLTNAVNGIAITGGTGVGLYYNTVYLNASSTATTFGTSGIYKSGSTTLTDLRNNVIMNLSTPGSAGGFTVAYQWSGAYSGSYYASASNANNFYAGTPSANHLVFYDGINSDQALSAYQARVSPKDALSFSENSPLMNSTVAPYDLHINPAIGTLCESGGVSMLSPAITDDFDGNARSTTPDAGADEFAGISSGVVNPSAVTAAIASSQQINLQYTPNPTNNTVVIVWNTTGYFTTPSGTPPAVSGSFAGGTVLSVGTTSPVAHTGLTGGVTYYYKAFSYNGTAYSSGVPVQATTTLAPPAPFSSYAMAFDRIDLSWTRNVQNHDVIIAVNSSNSFGQPVNGVTYAAGNTLPTAGTVIYTGPLTSFSHMGLTASTTYYYMIWSYDTHKWYSATGTATSTTTMLCAPTSSLPFFEGFEAYTPPAVGCGVIIDQNADFTTWGSGTSFPHTGTKSLVCFNPTGSGPNDDWYFIQGLNLTGGVTYQLSFWHRPQATYPTVKFEVKWGTSPTPGGMFNPPLASITSGTTTAYQQAAVFITPAVSGTYYFGWHSTSDPNFSTTRSIIDDISIATNTCTAPLSVTATGIITTTANIGWTGGATDVQIDYGTVGHAAGTGTIVSSSTNPQTLTLLSPLTSYDVYVRKDCGLSQYSFWTGPVTFTTLYQPPTVTTTAATALTGPGATLNGTVNAGGVSTQAYFEYGLTTSYGSIATATPGTVTGTSDTPISATIAGLAANNSTYHFRAAGFSGGVFTYGADQTFTTPLVAPTATTTAATYVTSSTATLNGTVSANNASSSVIFEYGLTASLGTTVTAAPSSLSGYSATAVSANILGLIPGSLYYYRVSSTNVGGTGTGLTMTFTAADVPTVTTGGFVWTPVTTNGTLVLNGTVNANNYSTTVTFQYGLTTTYGTTVNATAVVTGNAATPVTIAPITLSTSSLNNLYHYRTVAVNVSGTTYGSDMTYTTSIAPVATTAAATFTVPATPSPTAPIGVTLNGSVNANNAATTVIYEYGPTTSYGSTLAFPSNPVTGTTASTRAAVAQGLTPGATYHYRVTASNVAGTTLGNDFSVLVPLLPTATTLAATLVTATGARLNGTIVTNTTPAAPTNYRYEYGLTTAYGTIVTPTPGSGTTNTTASPAGTLSGLLPNTTYHYRVYAYNAGGIVYGNDLTFTTLGSLPVVVTTAAYGVTPQGATLNGTVDPKNSTATAGFEYGLTNTYGTSIVAAQSPVLGTSVTGVSAAIAGLQPNTLYYYRATATNPTGTANGSPLTFTTMAIPPTVTTSDPTLVTPFTATLNGTVNANNANTAVTFEYGLTEAYGSTVAGNPSPVIGGVTTGVSAGVTGLLPCATYHYRVVGVNAGGTGYSGDMIFTTPSDIVFTATAQQPLCFGYTGSVILSEPTGGTPPFTLDPANPATTGLLPGTYVYSITDALGCTVTASAVINAAPSLLELTAITVQPDCFGGTGSVSLMAGGGTPEYTYDPLNPPLTGLSVGTYTYYVTDFNGCSASTTVTIIAPLLVTNPQSTCSPHRVDLTVPSVTSGSIFLNGVPLTYWSDAAATIPMPDPTVAGNGTWYIKATIFEGCFEIKPVTVTINPLPSMLFVTGGGSYCAGGPGVEVALSGSQTGINYTLWNYNVQVSSPVNGNGYPISFGLQTAPGYYVVQAENATTGCVNWMFNHVVVSVTQPLPVGVSITASVNPVPANQDVTFTATPVNGGTTPSYQWMVNGFNTGTNSSGFTYKPVNGDAVSCILVSSALCVSGNPAVSNVVSMEVTGVSAEVTVSGIVAGGQTMCYNATQTITVAVAPATFTVQNGGSATMIAGQNIIYLPGTVVNEGGYMHGYISNIYCGQQAPSMVTMGTGNEEFTPVSKSASFGLYPNPTTGNFTLVQKGDQLFGNVKVDIYGMRGEKVLTTEIVGEKTHQFALANLPVGLYFVKLIAGEYTETIKLVITR